MQAMGFPSCCGIVPLVGMGYTETHLGPSRQTGDPPRPTKEQFQNELRNYIELYKKRVLLIALDQKQMDVGLGDWIGEFGFSLIVSAYNGNSGGNIYLFEKHGEGPRK